MSITTNTKKCRCVRLGRRFSIPSRVSGRLDRIRTKETYERRRRRDRHRDRSSAHADRDEDPPKLIENLRGWTRARNVSEPVGAVVEAEAARVVIDAKGRGKAKPGAVDLSDERWHTELDGRIDSRAAELDRHDHKKTTRSIEQLRAADEEIRADLDSKLEDLEGDLTAADRWSLRTRSSPSLSDTPGYRRRRLTSAGSSSTRAQRSGDRRGTERCPQASGSPALLCLGDDRRSKIRNGRRPRLRRNRRLVPEVVEASVRR
jgi:hypothetical protein